MIFCEKIRKRSTGIAFGTLRYTYAQIVHKRRFEIHIININIAVLPNQPNIGRLLGSLATLKWRAFKIAQLWQVEIQANEKPNSVKKLLGVFLKFCKIMTVVAEMVKALKGLFF